MERREFLRAGAVATLLAPQGVIGANDRVQVALIGAGGRGRRVTSLVPEVSNAQIAAVSDLYVPRREAAVQQFSPTAKPVNDYRRILDNKDIDAVVIGTPDHWHAPMTMEAVAAGKHVYVEKPVTHDLSEGDKLIDAVESSGRIVATGTQQRSWAHFIKAKEVIERGTLGKITFVRSYWNQNYSNWASRLPKIDQSQLDWDQWLGNAPKQKFDPMKFRFWRFYWDFGGGSFTDLFVHVGDVIQWYMDSPKVKAATALGATYTHKWMEAPDTAVATFNYPENYTAVFHGNMAAGLEGGGIVFRGSKAMMKLTRLGYAVYEEGAKPFEATSLPEPLEQLDRGESADVNERVDGRGTHSNVRNWLECIRSGKTPNAHIRAGVQSANTAHWANKALREGKVIKVT